MNSNCIYEKKKLLNLLKNNYDNLEKKMQLAEKKSGKLNKFIKFIDSKIAANKVFSILFLSSHSNK